MKKIISWLLIFALLFCLTGCDSEDVEDVINVAVPVLIAALEEEAEQAGETDPSELLESEVNPDFKVSC